MPRREDANGLQRTQRGIHLASLAGRAPAATSANQYARAREVQAPPLIRPSSRALVNLSFRDEPGVFIQQYSELVAAIERAVKRALDVVISMTAILFSP
jgi:hypothetical protein